MSVAAGPAPAAGAAAAPWRQRAGRGLLRFGKWTSRAPALVLRRLTAGGRALPDVYVLGATKCGTSSLYVYLTRHPLFVGAYLKELQFLQDLPHFETNYHHDRVAAALWGDWSSGEAAYRKFFPRVSTLERAGAPWGRRALTGEATPFYLYSAAAAERVAALTPEARFVIMLRNPVDRTFSDYHMHVRRDPDESRPLEQAIEDELSGRCRRFRLRYLHQGIYEPHVRTWMERFGRDRFLVLRAEDFFTDTRAEVRRTFEFLGLPPHELDDYPVVNQGSYQKKLGGRARQRLVELFRPHNRRLSEYLERDFAWDA